MEGNKALSKPEMADEKIFSIMRRCWEIDVDYRPSMQVILEKLVEISHQISEKSEEKEVLSFYSKKKEYHPVYMLSK